MADRKDYKREEKPTEAPAATPPAPVIATAPAAAPVPAPIPVAAVPPPKADAKSRAVTVAIWGALTWIVLRLVPQQKIPGVLKGFGSMLYEGAALPLITGIESLKAVARWSEKHGRRAFRFSVNVLLIAAIFFILGNDWEKRWMIGATLALMIPMIIVWWTAKKALVALIHEAVSAVGKGFSITGKTMAAILRRIGVVIPEEAATDETKGKYFQAIEKYLEKIFLAIIGLLSFLVVDFLKPGWGTVQGLMPIAFLAVIIGFYNAHLKIESDGEVRVMRWGLRLVLWFLAAAFFLPYTASVLTGKSFDRYLGDMLKDQTFGFSSLGILIVAAGLLTALWVWAASTAKVVRAWDGSLWENPRYRRRNALAIAGSILIPATVVFLFWRGDVTVAELKGKSADETVETAAKKAPEPTRETSKETTPTTGMTQTAPTTTAPRLDLPDPSQHASADRQPTPYRPKADDAPITRPAKRDTKPRRYSNFLQADDALREAGL